VRPALIAGTSLRIVASDSTMPAKALRSFVTSSFSLVIFCRFTCL
jgi:hypothetical protein